MYLLDGKTVLVTGGGRGLGAAVCETLARGGATVFVGERDPDLAEACAKRLRDDGLDAEWLEALDPPLDSLFRGAILHPDDGSLQPARWVRRLAARAAVAGAEILEESPVASLEELEADRVVIATDGYTSGLVPLLDEKIQPVRGQVVATEPLERMLFPRPHYARHGFDYWQQTPDGRLVLGGRRDTRLEDEFTNEEAITDEIQAELWEARASEARLKDSA